MGVRFLLDEEVVEVAGADPTATVLNLLRYRLRRTGTKEGCAEGDCGACTVLLGELDGDEAVVWRAVNACILFVPMLDGRALLTVESLSQDGGMHPVQHALVERHGSQCGFCTPGFVMSLYGRSIGAVGTAQTRVADVIAGNLCRCTGYGPILAAGEAVAVAPRDDRATAAALRTLRRETPLEVAFTDALGVSRRWFAPRTLDAFVRLRIDHPEARIVAGATDVGLWVTKQQRTLADVIWIGEIAHLRSLTETEAGLTLGAGVRYSDAYDALVRMHPELGKLVRRIGGLQVRNAGTLGGNIANGSPIADTPPFLIALGATLTLRRGDDRRTLPLEDFFLSYGVQDLQVGEFVESVFIPRPAPETVISVTKLSKRFDSDISAVCGAFALSVRDGVVAEVRIAFGGMAATPSRARGAEAALQGRPWTEQTVESAVLALAEDFRPLTDLRGSADYRSRVAGNLLRRLWIEQATPDEPTRVTALSHG